VETLLSAFTYRATVSYGLHATDIRAILLSLSARAR